ncbi:MAG: pitrilysin family protein [Cyanobacteria bacterium P01_E01_bin.45]
MPNGLTAILRPMAAAETVTVDIWIDTGGRAEPLELLGVSHFLEHMVFKGTDRIKPGELDFAIESRGGVANAVTSQDYTHYYITVAADDLADSLGYLAEAVTQASIPDEEFQIERNVVLEEIRRSHDNPDYCAYHLLAQTAYRDRPYSRPVLGTEASLMTFTPDTVRNYHRDRYRPERIAVVVVGKFELDSAQQLIDTHFGHLTASPSVLLPDRGRDSQSGNSSKSGNAIDAGNALKAARSTDSSCMSASAESLDGIQRVEQSQPRIEQTRVVWAWSGASMQQLDVACGLDLLASVLGDGRSSRLVSLLREQRGWVFDIGASSAVHVSPGLFSISAHLDRSHFEPVEAAVLAEIQCLHDEPVSEPELRRVQRMLTNEFIFATETPNQLARMYGFYHLCGGLELADRYLTAIQAMTAEALMQCARQYLRLDRFCVAILKPGANDEV